MVFHQGSVIRVVPHQSGLSSGWSYIRVVFHQGGLSSGWPLVRVACHQDGLSISSGLSLIMVVSHHFYLLYSVILLPAGSSRQRACCTDGDETHCWGITRSTISTAVFFGFLLSCGCSPSATAVWVAWCCEGWSAPAAVLWLCWFISVVLSDFSLCVHHMSHSYGRVYLFITKAHTDLEHTYHTVYLWVKNTPQILDILRAHFTYWWKKHTVISVTDSLLKN